MELGQETTWNDVKLSQLELADKLRSLRLSNSKKVSVQQDLLGNECHE